MKMIMKNLLLWGLIVLSLCSIGMTGAENPPANTVIVPNFEGFTMEEAVKILQMRGLQAQPQIANLGALVVSQSPQPGSALPVGGAVVLASSVQTTSPQPSTGVRTLQAPSQVTPQTRNAVTVGSPMAVAVTPLLTNDLRVTVAPSQTPPQTSRALVQQPQIVYQPAPVQQTRVVYQPAPVPQTRVVYQPVNVPVQQTRVVYQPAPVPQTRILYQAPQPAANVRGLADQTGRSYPTWYPQRFLAQANAQVATTSRAFVAYGNSGQRQLIQSVPANAYVVSSADSKASLAWYPRTMGAQGTRQYQVNAVPANASVLSNADSKTSLAWYPKTLTSQGTPQYQVTRQYQVTPQYQVARQSQVSGQSQVYGLQTERSMQGTLLAVAPADAAQVPNLARLYRDDALAALAKSGLAVGNIIPVQASQVGAGMIVRQSLQPRAIVPAGTPVDLWVAN